MSSRTEPRLDLRDPTFYAAGAGEVFRRLRHQDPVHWDEHGQMWVLTRHRDILEVSRDPALFCSGRGVLLGDRERTISPGQSILYLDPPAHSRYRAIVSREFHGAQVARLQDRIRQLAIQLLDQVRPGQPFDAVETLALPLPLLMISELLGVGVQDRHRLRAWSDAAIAAATSPASADLATAVELAEYFREAIARRQKEPRRDLISLLLTAEVDGQRLTEAELLGFCISLLVAGNETTRNLLSGGLLALATHPLQWRRLRDDPGLVPRATEELLRWVTPFMSFGRTATRDTELSGAAIRAGDFLLMLYISANRDEEVFGETADELDVGRDPNPHLSFGFAEHYCLGAGLARMEARVLLEELVTRYAAIVLEGEPRRTASAFVNGLVELPLSFRRV